MRDSLAFDGSPLYEAPNKTGEERHEDNISHIVPDSPIGARIPWSFNPGQSSPLAMVTVDFDM